MNKPQSIRRILSTALMLLAPITTSMAWPQATESITLKQAVQRALLNSRDVAHAEAQYNVSRSTVEVNRSVFRPNLFTGSGLAYTSGFPSAATGQPPSVINISYVQALYNPQMTAQLQASRERSESQRLELEKTRNSVMLETSSAYLELAKIRHSLDLMRNERQSNARILGFTRQRIAEGLELPIEATRAELSEARSEQRIIQAESRERVLERQLASLIGIPPDQHIEVEAASLTLNDSVRESELIERALINSLDVRQAELERSARQRILEGEIGSNRPSIDIVGEYAMLAKFNNYQEFYQKFQRNNVTIGISAKIPIFAAQRSANIGLARSDVTASEMALRARRLNVELDVTNKYQRVRELNAAREVARLELKLAQENLQLVQARFEEGRANLREIETARLEENSKWLAFLDSDYERQKAQLELMNTTGNLGQLLQ